MTVTLEYENDIAILNLGNDENRFTLQWLEAVDARLTEIAQTAPRALVTVGTGKFYSNGLDVDWLESARDQESWYVEQVQNLFNRILTYPMPTLAAINGHAFGAGAMLALSHDFRWMREDRGYFCFPEVDIKISFTVGMAALIREKLSPQASVSAMTTGRRFGGADALAVGIVDGIECESELISSGLDSLSKISRKDSDTLGLIKKEMFASVTASLCAGGRLLR